MARLTIHRQDAILEITSQRAQMHITTPRPQMTVTRVPPRMIVTRTQPQVHYSPRPLWTSRGGGVYTARGLVRYLQPPVFAPEETPAAHAGGDGRSVSAAALHRGSVQVQRANEQAAQAAQNAAYQRRLAEAEVRSHMEWDLGSVSVDWEITPPQINWEIGRPQVEVEPHAVEIRLRQYPKVFISFERDVARNLKMTGRRIDKRI